ncbi:rhomboid family protein [Lentiprolixibacter aurantiacus]|uniref:Rhomboid family intramembrane serine protease n=1 Tax=Lentiprolixibacter aurantiacus TaxID=2993939 RepID=A0AAE3MNE8_9FLAO|nr:rhomboid family intramembrane serine protease [Lentiprolixibacter aurantiacus]MCX2720413.1 rhomboid family intramembrane serine protease [Lentiprolixibacter aurantiacus]
MSTGNLNYQFARLNTAEKLIVINVAVYIIHALVVYLFALNGNAIVRWFELPADFFDMLSQPWSLVTYSFFHGGLLHLFFNMLVLYYVGRIFLNLFGNRTFTNVYFLGVILGGLLFLLSYNVFPAFMGGRTSLIGASAGVTAVLIFVCAYMPNQEVRLLFFNVKLWHIGAFIVLMDLVMITADQNPGGRIAHLGGAVLGYYYARRLLNGQDIGKGFSALLDSLASLFKKQEKKAPMKTVYRKNGKTGKKSPDYQKESRQRKIDAILDKISKSGYESLSKEEKDFLFKAGKED